MEGLKQSVHRIVDDVKHHAAIIVVCVVLTAFLRWVVWGLIPIAILVTVYAFWRRGVRVVIDRTEHRKEQKEC